jgi:hypothetical protein
MKGTHLSAMRRVFGTLAAASLLLSVSASFSLAAAPWFGFNDNSVTGQQISAAQSAGLAVQEGATSSRVTIDWGWVQPTPSSFNFGLFDWIYYADLARGIRPLLVLTGAPTWAWDSGVTCPQGAYCHYPPGSAHDADWQNIAERFAARYPRLAGIEIWMEPNMSWAWWGGLSAARYTQLLRLAYTGIKEANPSIPVIGGSLAADLSDTGNSTSIGVRPFLQAMYDNGARGYMDGISIHAYPEAMDWWYTYKSLSITTETRDANGDAVPLWITETGMSTTSNTWTENDQAIVLSNLVPPLLAYPGLAGAYVHTLVEPTNVPATQAGWGVMHPDLSPKPAFCSIAQMNQTSYQCPAGVAQPQPTTTQTLRWQAENLLQAAANAALAQHKLTGSYQSLTAPRLHAIDPRVSATPLSNPDSGPSADPSQILIWPMGPQDLLLCNASKADRSYCIYTHYRGTWAYGRAAGSVYQAESAVLGGTSQTW